MPKKKKEIPKFNKEDDGRLFWTRNDSTEFVDLDAAESVVPPKLKPTIRTISLRLSGSMLDQIRLIANKKDFPYQSPIKIFLTERVEKELKA